MSELRPDDGSEQDRWTVTDWTAPDLDVAVARLEDVLLALPYDRALPDLADILAAAGISEADLRFDDRALKILHEAVVARPLASIDQVATIRTEVELLTLEVRVLTERLEDPATSRPETERASRRLKLVREELDRIRRQL
jgi:hypothetical protein